MKRLIRLILGKETVTVSKEEIMKALFHRGKMLLLDQVTISDGKVVGEFTLPAENCEGHEPMPNMPVMRGVEIVEMAFQLLGVMVAKNPELVDMLKGKVFAAREVAGAKFSGFIMPGDKLILQTDTGVDIDEIGGTFKVESSRVVATVNGKKKCTIISVAIVAFDSALINQ
jgi:3-hydroxymyristoyl/3-hydroxydecanoyl-(acyl carrier protein) dehydratase